MLSIDFSKAKNSERLEARLTDSMNMVRTMALSAVTNGSVTFEDLVGKMVIAGLDLGRNFYDNMDFDIKMPESPIPLTKYAEDDIQALKRHTMTTLVNEALAGAFPKGAFGSIVDHAFMQVIGFGFALENAHRGVSRADEIIEALAAKHGKATEHDTNLLMDVLENAKPEIQIRYVRLAHSRRLSLTGSRYNNLLRRLAPLLSGF